MLSLELKKSDRLSYSFEIESPRIFCLNLHRHAHPSIAEAFVGFTPLLQFREPGILFGDVTKTLWLFKNPRDLLERILDRARNLGFSDASLALAETTAGAQTFTSHSDLFIADPGCEKQALAKLPVSSLKELEGLYPWARPTLIDEIAEFFGNLGHHSLADLMQLPSQSWNLRWGDLGTQLEQKLMGREKSAIAPLRSALPLVAYHHFEFPVYDLEGLLNSLRPRLLELFFRLEGREMAVDQLSLLMVRENSGITERILISPAYKARDIGLIITILRGKLKDLRFENPIREWEIEIFPSAAQSPLLQHRLGS